MPVHAHDHRPSRGPGERNRYLVLALLSFVTFAVEFTAGVVSKSTVLRADALHTLFDTLESLINAGVAQRSRIQTRAEQTRRFGFCAGALLLILSTGWMGWDALAILMGTAVQKLPSWAVWVACFALGMNMLMWYVHEEAHAHDRNLTHWTQRLHILTDMGGSGVAIAGTLLASIGAWPTADAWGALLIVVVVWVRLGYAGWELFARGRAADAAWTSH